MVEFDQRRRGDLLLALGNREQTVFVIPLQAEVAPSLLPSLLATFTKIRHDPLEAALYPNALKPRHLPLDSHIEYPCTNVIFLVDAED